MNIRTSAVPGQWYLDRRSGDTFQIVGLNEEDGSIEIQYSDGSVGENSLDEWATLELEDCEQPEDWVGPFDDLEPDDVGIPENTAEPHSAELPMERALLEIEEQRAPDLIEPEE